MTFLAFSAADAFVSTFPAISSCADSALSEGFDALLLLGAEATTGSEACVAAAFELELLLDGVAAAVDDADDDGADVATSRLLGFDDAPPPLDELGTVVPSMAIALGLLNISSMDELQPFLIESHAMTNTRAVQCVFQKSIATGMLLNFVELHFGPLTSPTWATMQTRQGIFQPNVW